MIIEQNEYAIDVEIPVGMERAELEEGLPNIGLIIRGEPRADEKGAISHGARSLQYAVSKRTLSKPPLRIGEARIK